MKQCLTRLTDHQSYLKCSLFPPVSSPTVSPCAAVSCVVVASSVNTREAPWLVVLGCTRSPSCCIRYWSSNVNTCLPWRHSHAKIYKALPPLFLRFKGHTLKFVRREIEPGNEANLVFLSIPICLFFNLQDIVKLIPWLMPGIGYSRHRTCT